MDKIRLNVSIEQLDQIMQALLALITPYQQLVQNLHEQANRQLNPAPTPEEEEDNA